MSVFLLTSRFEGLPNVLVEAQSHGIPVVSTRAGGSGETFINGETGWLVNERQPEILAARVLDVLESPEWRARCAVRAMSFARQMFNAERMLDATTMLYELPP